MNETYKIIYLYYEKIFGKPFTSFKNRFFQVRLFYFSISLGGIILYFYTAFFHLPNKYLGPIHFYIMPMVIAFIYVSFYVASVSNSDYVTKENVDKLCKHFKYDHILFAEKTCETCKLQNNNNNNYNKTIKRFR
ncbi:hypothetical protein BCR32DRAFT_305162 [Anaeromyces robustus]|uniref:Uncharacterized protein n=1 Tax=Anaeromyces robustus TaxID=1754192 RepID=A0A1Y1WJ01_9FUNG|nr:hypothetical protein BCR32DRAFT_305162 [Anaeromyces robustus]|eukprot:ORX73517.1 hypothetical protein BCR32DRAFT_305162 [Anaeromyces robustus]